MNQIDANIENKIELINTLIDKNLKSTEVRF